MASTTSTQHLPYPQGTDAFCDGWSYTQQLAEAVDALLDSLDDDAEFLELVPYARVSRSAAYDHSTVFQTLLSYDTVDTDTAELVDLSRNNTAITIDRQGIWMGGGALWHTSTGTAGNYSQLDMNLNHFDGFDDEEFAQQGNRDPAGGSLPRLVTSGYFDTSNLNTFPALLAAYVDFTGTNVPATVSMFPLQMFAFWVADL